MADDQILRLGEDIKLYLDTAHVTGGVWGSATWVEAKCADELSGDRGIISAEFECRGEEETGSRRSTRRNRTLSLSLFVKPGDAAYDRLMTAADNQNNDGSEILRLALVDGDITTAGNKMVENDYVVVSASDDYPSSEGAKVDLELKRAADSPNTRTVSTTS